MEDKVLTLIKQINLIPKGGSFSNVKEKTLRKELLIEIGDNNVYEVGGFVVKKSFYNNKPFVMIYTSESFKKAEWYRNNKLSDMYKKGNKQAPERTPSFRAEFEEQENRIKSIN